MDPNSEMEQLISEFYSDFKTRDIVDEGFAITPELPQRDKSQQLPSSHHFTTRDINKDYGEIYPQLHGMSANENYNVAESSQNDLAYQLAGTAFLDVNNMDFELNIPGQVQSSDQQFQSQHSLEFQAGQSQLQAQPQHGSSQASDQIHSNLQNTQLQTAMGNEQDNMEIDESPPFTIESDLYFDQALDNNSVITNNRVHNQDGDSLSRNRLSVFSQNTTHSGLPNSLLKSPMQPNEIKASPFDNNSRASSYQNIQHASCSNSNSNSAAAAAAAAAAAGTGIGTTNTAYESMAFTNGRNLFFDSENQQIVGRLRNGSIDSYYAANVINQHALLQSQQPHQSQQSLVPNSHSHSHSHSHQQLHSNGQFLNQASQQELSPLTTSTSHTQSVSSLHSTQASFFSAQQYIKRNSFDHQSGSQHRPSSEGFGRPSIVENTQSQQSQQRNPRYLSFTNSISNIIPFMGDKNQQRSPPHAQNPAPQSLFKNNNSNNNNNNSNNNNNNHNSNGTQPQSRHLIRSIFKSSTPQAAVNEDLQVKTEENVDTNMDEIANQFLHIPQENSNFANTVTVKEENEPEPEFTTSTKKVKAPKRSLFTRFKSSKQEDGKPTVEEKLESQDVEMGDHIEPISNPASSGTPSIMTSGAAVDALENSTSETSQSNEPDYAALFENVGKRKPSSATTGKQKKEKVKAKEEPSAKQSSTSIFFGKQKNKQQQQQQQQQQNQQHQHQQYQQQSVSSGASIVDNASERISVSSSNASSNVQRLPSNDMEQQNLTPPSTPGNSTLASASKRILGSKIMSKTSSSSSKKACIKSTKKITEEELERKETPIIASLDTPVATMISKGVEVQVDLASLDLPPDTKIFPTSIINSKNRTRGRKENKEADLNDESKIYLCNYCSRRFKRHEHLKRHFRSLHTFEKPYDCSICNKKFSRSDNLNQHLKIHKLEEEEEAAAAAAAAAGGSGVSASAATAGTEVAEDMNEEGS
ncbi:uncharacterized protein LODBEIA_P16180 [Lodderomyces beijingensis]|uniref:C2H2-type domain-containing protein n=1 Tax=Lodderomyces beijingensis TaxID=1775926 RepID=A0ABP0ZGW2_9ASCO